MSEDHSYKERDVYLPPLSKNIIYNYAKKRIKWLTIYAKLRILVEGSKLEETTKCRNIKNAS